MRGSRREAGHLAILAVAGIAASCTLASDEDRFFSADAPITIVETRPADAAVGVSRVGPIDICLSGVVDPRSVDGVFDVSIFSGQAWFDLDVEVQLFVWRAASGEGEPEDPPWCPGSVISVWPRQVLQPGLRHRLRLRPRFHGWAGEALEIDDRWTLPDDPEGEAQLWLSFTTGEEGEGEGEEELVPGPPTPMGPTLAELFAPGAVFAGEGGACGCHREEGSLARARLDLSAPAAAHRDLVLSPRDTGTEFALVAPRRPALSHLVHTLMRDDGGAALHGLPGAPMPPAAPASLAHRLEIVRWIAAGALP